MTRFALLLVLTLLVGCGGGGGGTAPDPSTAELTLLTTVPDTVDIGDGSLYTAIRSEDGTFGCCSDGDPRETYTDQFHRIILRRGEVGEGRYTVRFFSYRAEPVQFRFQAMLDGTRIMDRNITTPGGSPGEFLAINLDL